MISFFTLAVDSCSSSSLSWKEISTLLATGLGRKENRRYSERSSEKCFRLTNYEGEQCRLSMAKHTATRLVGH